MPWWFSLVHAYLEIGNGAGAQNQPWSAGFQSDDEIYSSEKKRNITNRKCFDVKKKKTGFLPNGKPCKCASCSDIVKCIKNEGTPGYAGYYSFFFRNCAHWAMDTLNKCCMKGRIPWHYFGPRL